MGTVVMALDQGTTSSRTILFDRTGAIIAVAQREFTQHYPQPGWVEHDLAEIWQTQQQTAVDALAQAGLAPGDVHAVGITNQRETVCMWERATGNPVHRAIVWQCRRTAEQCRAIREQGDEPMLRERTGLVADPYFSGTKLAWLLDQVPGLRARAEAGELCFGTIDSWLAFRLTGGRRHITDHSNASRTLLYNIHTRDWDPALLDYFRIPPALLPELVPSAGPYGPVDEAVFGAAAPLAGMAGDQQAALFGQGCHNPGDLKNTYGTGCFALLNTGDAPVLSDHGLITSMGWQVQGEHAYILEGSVFVAGAALQWLRDGLGILSHAADSESMAGGVADTGGVIFVPAFVGLGAPYWASEARGALVGLTRGTTREHIVRAALESIAFQSRELVDTMLRDGVPSPAALRVDGGAIANNFLCQFQADVLGLPVDRPKVLETTAAGAAYLAGLATGFWDALEQVAALRRVDRIFEPTTSEDWRQSRLSDWRKAVERVLR